MLFLPHKVELKNVEIEIYNYIAANVDKVIYMRIRDLASATHVSTTTILRFCKKFECEGFTDFKLKLQQYVKEQTEKHQDIQRVDEMPYIDFLRRTTNDRFQQKIAEAAQILLEVDLVLFVGIGTSGIIAAYGAMLFSSMFTLALPIADPLNTPLTNISRELNKRIGLVALSVSGENKDIVDYINQLKIHQAKIISITNSSNSTISNISDVNIPYFTGTEMFQDTNITSQLPVTYILEILAKRVYNDKHSA